VTDSFTIGTLKVSVNIPHTYVGDLTVTLEHGGRSVVLHRNEGGSADNLVKTFEVDEFDGMNVSGAWELHVADTAAVDVGTIRELTLFVSSAGGASGGGTSGTIAPVRVSEQPATHIPDSNAAGITRKLRVDASGAVRTLKVSVDIDHPYIGDLIVKLSHNGNAKVVHDRGGGSADDIVRSFSLTEFNGMAAAGDWEISVVDRAARDVGTLRSWGLELTVQ
jgi:subtilisin-like proprotein convertase family protein